MADIPFLVPNVEYAVVTTSVRDALQTPPESGFVDARSTYERSVRVVSLVWENADRAVAHEVLWLYDNTLGGIQPMTWDPPAGDADFDVRFVGRPMIELDRRSLERYRIAVELEEAL